MAGGHPPGQRQGGGFGDALLRATRTLPIRGVWAPPATWSQLVFGNDDSQSLVSLDDVRAMIRAAAAPEEKRLTSTAPRIQARTERR